MTAGLTGIRRSDAVVNTDLDAACSDLEGADQVFLDTETMGFNGLCFLIQFSTAGDPCKVHLIRVLRETPAAIRRLLDLLVTKKLVIHNAAFDIFHLAKLYTLSCLVKAFTFDEIWRAEAILRPDETTYEQRLGQLYSFYPAGVVDTMLVAQHTLPLGDQFLGDCSFKLFKFPYICLEGLRSAFSSAVAWPALLKKYGLDDRAINYLAVHKRVSVQVEHSNTNRAREKLKSHPEKYAVTVNIKFSGKGVFTLKNLAKYYGYCDQDSITDFEFLTGFSEKTKLNKRSRAAGAPTVFDRDLYEKLFLYCRAGYADTVFLDYAVRDVLLLEAVYQSQPAPEVFSEALATDLALVPHFANLRLYGVKVDRAACEKACSELSSELNAKILELAKLGLDRPTSRDCALPWLRAAAGEALGLSDDEARRALPNTDRRFIKKVATKAKSSEKIRAFVTFKQLEGVLKLLPRNTDTLYPEYNLYGTVTHRMTAKRPNPQQIPKDERARRIFTAPTGWDIYVGDYDQLELRIMAYTYRVNALCAAFQSGRDPHSKMGADMLHDQIGSALGRPLDAEGAYLEIHAAKQRKSQRDQSTATDKVVLGFRDVGKVMNFGIIYGMTPFGLADQLSCTVDEAKKYIKHYFDVVPELAEAMAQSNSGVMRLRLSRNASHSRIYQKWECDRDPIAPVVNRVGVKRGFALAHSTMRLMNRIKDRDYKAKYLRSAGKEHLEAYDASLRSGFKQIQGAIKREAFNFGVQSTGAYLTKVLQRRICDEFIAAGAVHKASALDLLPTLNVHDELHFYVKSVDAGQRLGSVTRYVLDELSGRLGGQISLKFDAVGSWADKA